MRTRPKAIALAAVIGVVAFAPVAAFAQQEQAQAATQVTVDLSELERSAQHEPLAQTGDTRQLLAAGIAAAGTGAIGLGLHIKRSQ
ncbi:hypothetical protein [Collinsella sp. OM08-14AT]|uniref:hypothetical protein n=1 Tax=Collinsella sp. OM08-14AT TaxID=2292329 RepID=UPI000E44F876|nr:hypothetical protein [Collinsella sp. OM08-14AT]RGM31839.1 hypothetical protein DXC18_04740 [Collinsella sp. OM08-14AT]